MIHVLFSSVKSDFLRENSWGTLIVCFVDIQKLICFFSENTTNFEILVPKKFYTLVCLCPPSMFTFQISYSKISLENQKCCMDLGYIWGLLRDFPTIVKLRLSKSWIFLFSKDILEFETSLCPIAYRLNWRSLVKFLGVTFLIKFFGSKIVSILGFVHISCRGISHNFENKAHFLKIGENVV